MAESSHFLEFEAPLLEIEQKIEELKLLSAKDLDFSKELKKLERKAEKLKAQIFSKLSAWEKVQLTRHPQRPYTFDYIEYFIKDFVELHGDRLFKEDCSIVGGLGRFEGTSVVVLGHQKGRNTKQNMTRNFGMPKPEGYRKAIRLMKLADRFYKPVITFIDTPGAYPGIDAEERGQAEAIASSIMCMTKIKVPVISVIIGEGGSGGALGIGVANRLLMLEYSTYSVISPEGCASILWKNQEQVSAAAKALKLSAQDLLELGVIDEIIPEPLGGAHRDYNLARENVKRSIKKHLDQLKKMKPEQLVKERYEKYRKIGVFEER
jgi:acetyl-CoA carboxylase carboxyl transferase subunit alpha